MTGDFERKADGTLRFACGACGHGLEAPVAYAGVEAPCPVCGAAVRAPVPETTAPVELPAGFWEEADASPVIAEVKSEAQVKTLPPVPMVPPLMKEVAAVAEEVPAELPTGHTAPLRVALESRESEEAEASARHRQRAHRLRFFDGALVLLLLGLLAVGAAAVVFTQSKQAMLPAGPPELSRLVVERMQRLDDHRDQAVEAARQTLGGLLGVADAASAERLLMPDGAEAEGWTYPLFAGGAPDDFEFIQARRIPGTERFLTLFEMVADPPLVIPVEETLSGTLVHGQALAQQWSGRLGKFLASQGQGEAVFYVLLRPAPAAMAAEFLQARPDLRAYELVSVEPAFPADGAQGCLVCLTPGSEASGIFAKRSHDPGLRPAVVRLAWRQHREAGAFIELSAFQPNAWSRH